MKAVNILLIVVDALRADHLPCYGYARNTTPRLSKVFSRASIFSRCFSPVGWTLPACASIITGRMPDAHGLVDHNCRFRVPKLGHYLGDAFHRLAITNNGNLVPDYISETTLDSLGFEDRPAKWKNFGWESGFDEYLWTHRVDHLRPFELATRFLDNVRTTSDKNPWFMFFHTNIVHDYHMDHWYYQQVEDLIGHDLHPALRAFPDGPEIWGSIPEELDIREAQRQILAKYDSGIRYADERIADVLELVDLTSTIVVFTSDHGEGFEPERGRVHHCGRLHNDLLHVPLVVYLPEDMRRSLSVRAGIDKISSTLDIAPTLLRLLEYPAQPFDGEYLFDLPERRLLQGSERGYIFWSEDYKRDSYDTCEIEVSSTLEYPLKQIISRRDEQVITRSYNLANDPNEHIDLCSAENDTCDTFEAITFVVAVTDETLLQTNLLASPVSQSTRHEWVFVHNKANCRYASMSSLYQDHLERAANDLVFFLHQDVFLPPDWERQMFSSLRQLEFLDSQWGIVGAVGAHTRRFDSSKVLLGHWGDVAGYSRHGSLPAVVQTLDELWLGLRKSRGICFDREMPGFHCYGADICLSAYDHGLKSYAIDAFVWHKYREADTSFVPRMSNHPKVNQRLTTDFLKDIRPCAAYVEKKWQQYLPFHSTYWSWGATAKNHREHGWQ